MITWIVSYPRSGNYLTRQILQRCFGQKAERYAPAAQSIDSLLPLRADGKHYIKTHCIRTPRSHEKVIYVARDARAAMSSYHQFTNNIGGRADSLEDVIRADALWRPDWSAHVCWALDRDPANTLMLRYENLSTPSPETLATISRFIGLPVIGSFDKSFEWYRERRPLHCRVGHNGEGIAAVEAQCSSLFWRTHGETMQRLGYAPAYSIAAE